MYIHVQSNCFRPGLIIGQIWGEKIDEQVPLNQRLHW